MQIRFIDKTIFQIYGYSVETSLEESEQDVAALYSDYFSTEKSSLIDNVAKNKAAEYYGLMWYLEGHERYREYYPDGVDGNYELWTPVVKADV